MSQQEQQERPRHLHTAITYLMLTLGSGFVACGVELILAPNSLVDGGVTALSILGSRLFDLPTAVIFLALNTPILLLGAKALGSRFFVRSLYCNVVVTLLLWLLTPLPAITSSDVLIVLYGGAALGVGVGVVIRNGAAVDGSEVIALMVQDRFGVPISRFLLSLNVVILSLSALVFSVEQAMMSVAVFFLVSRLIDYVLEGINSMFSVMIITQKPEAIRERLTQSLALRITILKGYGGYTGEARDVIYCVMDRFTYVRVRSAVVELDTEAIIEASRVTEATGVSARPLRHHLTRRQGDAPSPPDDA